MKYERITRLGEYRTVYQQGKVVFGKYVALHYIPQDCDQVKVGLSVSKKVGNAVTRNRVKRKLREVMNTLIDQLPHGFHIVIGAKASSKNATFWQLQADLRKILKGSRLLR